MHFSRKDAVFFCTWVSEARAELLENHSSFTALCIFRLVWFVLVLDDARVFHLGARVVQL